MADLGQLMKLCWELEAPQSKDALRQRLAAAAAMFGFPIYLLGVRGIAKATGQPEQLALTNVPDSWQRYYDDNELWKGDPFLMRAVSFRKPMRFEDIAVDSTSQSYRTELAKHGMGHGVICAYKTLGFIGVLTFTGTEAIRGDKWERIYSGLGVITSAATRAVAAMYEKGESKEEDPGVELTPEEREVMELSAQGLKASEVAASMNINVRRVRHLMDLVVRKLGVRNRKAAVTEALARGLIRRRHFAPPRFEGNVDKT